MLLRPPSQVLSFAVACLGLATLTGPALADVIVETSYLPTSAVVGVSSTLLPTSYVVPTSFSTTYLPTSYVATSGVLTSDSVVYPTSTTILRRRSIFRPWRYVDRAYYSYPSTAYVSPTSYLSTSTLLPTSYITSSSLLPTSYIASSSLLPTVYLTSPTLTPTSYLIDRGLVATSATVSDPCETSPLPTRATVARPTNANAGEAGETITSKPANGGAAAERRPQGMVNNGTASDEGAASPTKPNDVPPVVQVPGGKQDSPPPSTPIEEKKPEDIPLPPPGKSGAGNTTPGDMSYQTVRRPSSYDSRNILRGRVISAETRLPEEGVTVILANETKTYSDRRAMSDADGEFKISLPDGDWRVKVKMPSGSVYQVGRDYLTANRGRVTDPSGRNVVEFLISR